MTKYATIQGNFIKATHESISVLMQTLDDNGKVLDTFIELKDGTKITIKFKDEDTDGITEVIDIIKNPE